MWRSQVFNHSTPCYWYKYSRSNTKYFRGNYLRTLGKFLFVYRFGSADRQKAKAIMSSLVLDKLVAGRVYSRYLQIMQLHICRKNHLGIPMQDILRKNTLDLSIRIVNCFLWYLFGACHNLTDFTAPEWCLNKISYCYHFPLRTDTRFGEIFSITLFASCPVKINYSIEIFLQPECTSHSSNTSRPSYGGILYLYLDFHHWCTFHGKVCVV